MGAIRKAESGIHAHTDISGRCIKKIRLTTNLVFGSLINDDFGNRTILDDKPVYGNTHTFKIHHNIIADAVAENLRWLRLRPLIPTRSVRIDIGINAFYSRVIITNSLEIFLISRRQLDIILRHCKCELRLRGIRQYHTLGVPSLKRNAKFRCIRFYNDGIT